MLNEKAFGLDDLLEPGKGKVSQVKEIENFSLPGNAPEMAVVALAICGLHLIHSQVFQPESKREFDVGLAFMHALETGLLGGSESVRVTRRPGISSFAPIDETRGFRVITCVVWWI